MKNQTVEWSSIETTIEEIASMHRKNLLALARRIVPTATSEDILQPNDYPELDHHPEFRYEEGILAGIHTIQMALRAQKNRC